MGGGRIKKKKKLEKMIIVKNTEKRWTIKKIRYGDKKKYLLPILCIPEMESNILIKISKDFQSLLIFHIPIIY